jgi:hypothetical protein
MISTDSSKPVTRRYPLGAVLVALALSLTGLDVHAGDPAIAESLFRQGKDLMKQGDYGKACPKLAESQRLDPASGTMLAVALCHEKEGKLATAWAEYFEADALARQDGRTARSEAAQKRAAALEPQLAKLEIVVDEATGKVPGLQIRLDGVVLQSAVWSTAMPVDPGEHSVEVTATHKQPWQTTVAFTEPAQHQQIAIGPLEDLPPEPLETEGPKPLADEGQESSGATWVVGGILGGLGVAAMGVGTFFGVRALDQIGEAQDRCSVDQCTDPEAVDLNDSGALSADLSTGLLIGGGVATAAGIALLLTAALQEGESSEAASADPIAFGLRPLVMPASAALDGGGGPAMAAHSSAQVHGAVVVCGGVW